MGEPIRGSNQRWALTSRGESYPHSILRRAELYLLLHLARPMPRHGLDLRIAQSPRPKDRRSWCPLISAFRGKAESAESQRSPPSVSSGTTPVLKAYHSEQQCPPSGG